MIALILGLSLGEVMWGERAMRTCWNIQPGHKKQLDVSQCGGVDHYYFRNAQGRLIPRSLPTKAKIRVMPTGLGYTWKFCEDQNRVTHPFREDGAFWEQCAPDVVYSWQNCSDVESFRKNSTPDNVFPVDQHKGYFYTWRTPAGTVGYNGSDCSVRIKLKKSAQFTSVTNGNRNCDQHPGAQIIANHWGDGQEFIICDGSVVESWSAHTPEHLEEIAREERWVREQAHTEFDHFSGDGGGDCWIKQSYNFKDIKDAVTNFTRAMRHSPGGRGFVLFAGGRGKREDHFRTKMPGYFNPRGLK